MNKTRLPILIVMAALALTAIIAAQAYSPSGGTQEVHQSYSDTEDPDGYIIAPPSLQARAQESGYAYAGTDWIERHPTVKEVLSVSESGTLENGHTYAGTGDPSRVRFKLSIRDAGTKESAHTYAGTGDPLRFRVWPSITNGGAMENGHTYAGTGDPYRYRAPRETQNAGGDD